jgi:hypothetical protein
MKITDEHLCGQAHTQASPLKGSLARIRDGISDAGHQAITLAGNRLSGNCMVSIPVDVSMRRNDAIFRGGGGR